MKEIYLAGGSFWDLQRYFDCVAGVLDTQAGFANGNMMHPSYMEVCTGQTGFAETVRIRFDEVLLPLRGVLDLYYRAVGPILAGRGHGSASQHRLGIYYLDLRDRSPIIEFVREAGQSRGRAMASEVEPLRNYYPAEKYHQHYHEKNPNGYRHIEKEAFTYAGQYKV